MYPEEENHDMSLIFSVAYPCQLYFGLILFYSWKCEHSDKKKKNFLDKFIVTIKLWYWNLIVGYCPLSQVKRLQIYTDYTVITESITALLSSYQEGEHLKIIFKN